MRRIRLRLGRRAFFVAAFAVALVLLIPLRLALDGLTFDDRGLAARAVRGSVWTGAVDEAQLGGTALGDLRARLDPLPLLLGRARVAFEGREEGAAERLRGAVGVSRNGFALDDVSARIGTGAVFAPLPISALDLSDVSARFEDGVCESAEGRVSATVSGSLGGISLGQGLSGSARCDAGALLLPLGSQAGTERLDLRITPLGTYTATLAIAAGDPLLGQQLTAFGFQPGEGGYRLEVQGAF